MFPINDTHQAEVSKAYIDFEGTDLIRKRILTPLSDVPKSGKIPVFGNGLAKVITTPSAPMDPAAVLTHGVQLVDFGLETYRRKVPVSDEEMADYDLPLTPVKIAAEGLKYNRDLTQELVLSTFMETTAGYAAGHAIDVSALTQWNDPGGGQAALDEFSDAIALIGSGTDLLGVLSWDVYIALRRAWADLLSETRTPDPLALEAMARLAGLDRGFVLGAAEYDASEDPEAESMTRVWTNGTAYVVRIAPNGNARNHSCFGFSLSRGEKVTTPRIAGEDPEGYNVIAHGQYANAITDKGAISTAALINQAVHFYNCLS